MCALQYTRNSYNLLHGRHVCYFTRTPRHHRPSRAHAPHVGALPTSTQYTTARLIISARAGRYTTDPLPWPSLRPRSDHLSDHAAPCRTVPLNARYAGTETPSRGRPCPLACQPPGGIQVHHIVRFGERFFLFPPRYPNGTPSSLPTLQPLFPGRLHSSTETLSPTQNGRTRCFRYSTPVRFAVEPWYSPGVGVDDPAFQQRHVLCCEAQPPARRAEPAALTGTVSSEPVAGPPSDVRPIRSLPLPSDGAASRAVQVVQAHLEVSQPPPISPLPPAGTATPRVDADAAHSAPIPPVG